VLALGTLGGAGCQAETGRSSEPAVSARKERALPRFEGTLLDGERASTDLLRRKRAILFFFASTDSDAPALMEVLARVGDDARESNVTLIGVNRDEEASSGRGFLRTYGMEAPVFSDSRGAISRAVGVAGGRSAVVVVDAEGYLILGFQGLDSVAGIDPYEKVIRESLHLGSGKGAVSPALGLRPEAPDFEVQTLAGDKLILADLEGKIAVVVFFSPSCPHCHSALRFLQGLVEQLDNPDLAVVSISVQNKKYVIEDMVSRMAIDLPMYVDPKDEVFKDYAHSGTVPDIVILDREGRVASRHSGMTPRLEALMTMQIKHLLGVSNPILLDAKGYSGEEFCSVCHESQHETWALTNHAYAFTTLAEHGADRDPECVGCHTAGFGQAGGYDLKQRQTHLEGVQCENCHGRGGPHQSPEFAKQGYEQTCAGCHTSEHSLRFVFGERLPLVSHAANAQFGSLSAEERKALIERRDRRERKLFDRGEFVGSAACAGCHESEHSIWSASPHARAFATLVGKKEHENGDCQRCHTTGFEEAGGFPQGGDALTGVGCESCHGPGGSHVAEGARREGTILALTDKCDSCVIMQICGSCHDEANDPGFEFELLDKIDAIRHGFRDRDAHAQATSPDAGAE